MPKQSRHLAPETSYISGGLNSTKKSYVTSGYFTSSYQSSSEDENTKKGFLCCKKKKSTVDESIVEPLLPPHHGQKPGGIHWNFLISIVIACSMSGMQIG